MLSTALFASFADNTEQRYADRRVLRLAAQMATASGTGGIQVHNLSRTGMLIEADASVRVGETIEVELPHGAVCRAEIVWADDALFGCHFAEPLTQAMLSAALLRAEPLPAKQPLPADKAATLNSSVRPAIEPASARTRDERLPLGWRMWIIATLGTAVWAVPAAAAILLL